MKNILILFVILILGNTLSAQSKKVKEVETRVEALRSAMVDGDRSRLENITTSDLSYGHSNGKIESKLEFVESIASGNSNFESIELTNQSINLHDKTAIVRHDLVGKTHDNGKAPGEVKLHILTVWVKEGKDWKLLSRQAVKKV